MLGEALQLHQQEYYVEAADIYARMLEVSLLPQRCTMNPSFRYQMDVAHSNLVFQFINTSLLLPMKALSDTKSGHLQAHGGTYH